MQYKISNKKNYSVTDIFLVHSFANDPYNISDNLVTSGISDSKVTISETGVLIDSLCQQGVSNISRGIYESKTASGTNIFY